MGGWVGLRASLDMVVKRKNPGPLLGLEHPIIQPIAQHYSTELSWLPSSKYIPCMKLRNVYKIFVGKSEESNQKT
jgi:hypothetical protein